MAGSGARPQVHFGQHPYPNAQPFQYPHLQQPYMGLLSQQPGAAQSPASQAYPASLAAQRPSLYPTQSGGGSVGGQAGGLGGSLPPGVNPGSWQNPQLQQQGGINLAALQMSQQAGTPASMAQLGGPPGGNPMQGMFLRPGPSPLPQGGMLHPSTLSAQGAHLAGQQPPSLAGLRPASFLQV